MLSPHFKNGRYSRDLPTRIAARAAEALRNPRLLSLSDDVAVAEARLAELLAQVETGESGACWRALRSTMAAFSAAMASGDVDGMQTQFQAMRALVERGVSEAAVWDEVRRTWEIRSKLVATEMKTMTSLQQMLTVQQALLLQTAQAEALVKAVGRYADPTTGMKILRDVQEEFTRLATLEER